ncbi:MAG TPA: peptidoglycan-associated lipoprotein Pal [Candidatus Polarisedimenticolia bacterium]|nr:peptidoglycan-associated lipoprotein Pal [Candidatus Polarisedimenticolia bacterium]
MTVRSTPQAPWILCLMIATLIGVGGCKTKPPVATTTPEPPAVQKTDPAPEPVREEPMKPVIEEKPVAPRALGAADYNRQGLLKAVYFDFDKSEVRPDQRPTLQANAERLKGDLSKFKLLIEGHCDERGTNEYNMALGDKRANAVKQYLIDLGIPAARIRTISYGEERPTDPGHGEQSWARNRRCEFILEEG